MIAGLWVVLDRVLKPIETQIASIDTRLQTETMRAGGEESRLDGLVSELNAAVQVLSEASRHLEVSIEKFDSTVDGLQARRNQYERHKAGRRI